MAWRKKIGCAGWIQVRSIKPLKREMSKLIVLENILVPLLLKTVLRKTLPISELNFEKPKWLQIPGRRTVSAKRLLPDRYSAYAGFDLISSFRKAPAFTTNSPFRIVMRIVELPSLYAQTPTAIIDIVSGVIKM